MRRVDHSGEVDPAEVRRVALGVAYRMLGSRTEAEDLAQETVLRVRSAAAEGEVRSVEAFTTTVTTRLAIDHLRLARVRREQYLGPWLPEPVADDPFGDPTAAADLADSLSFALLVALESLSPAERAAFLLHDAFGYGYAELATTLGRTEAACRQLVSRARRRVGEQRVSQADVDAHEELVRRFVVAARTGDVDQLAVLLTEDVVLTSDGGPGRKAARHPIVGEPRVRRFLHTIGPRMLEVDRIEIRPVNGQPGFVGTSDGLVVAVGTVEVHDGRISRVRFVLNPDKLRWVRPG